MAKDETPKQPIIEINNPAPGKVIMRAPTLDDDPIIDDDEESPINALKSRIPLQVTVNSPSRKQVPAPYVPSFNKAKGKATTSSNSSFQRASSIQVGLHLESSLDRFAKVLFSFTRPFQVPLLLSPRILMQWI